MIASVLQTTASSSIFFHLQWCIAVILFAHKYSYFWFFFYQHSWHVVCNYRHQSYFATFLKDLIGNCSLDVRLSNCFKVSQRNSRFFDREIEHQCHHELNDRFFQPRFTDRIEFSLQARAIFRSALCLDIWLWIGTRQLFSKGGYWRIFLPVHDMGIGLLAVVQNHCWFRETPSRSCCRVIGWFSI